MSSNTSNHDDMTFELLLQREEFVARYGPVAGANFDDIYRWDPDFVDNDSDDEEESWTARGNRSQRCARRIDAMEAEQSHSDPGPDNEERVPSSLADLRQLIAREGAQGNVSSADQAIFAEYFGDRYRRPNPRTGRGWQNTVRIAAGERIPNNMYGLSVDTIRNTTLEEPNSTPAGPPPGMCVARRVYQRRIEANAESVRLTREDERNIRRNQRDRERQQAFDLTSDQREDALRAHRRSNDVDAMRNELKARVMVFKEEDSAGFEAWVDHITLASLCSTSKSRQHQIIQWYTRSVPGRVLRQVRRVEKYYTTEKYLQERLLLSQVNAGARRAPDSRYHARDDDIWAGNIKNLFFGYDPEHTVNGFQDYVPKGEGAAMIKHLSFNFAARKVRLQHASREHFPILAHMMNEFVSKALVLLNEPEHTNEIDPVVKKLTRRACEFLEYYEKSPLQYHPERDINSSAVGIHGADGDNCNDSNSSEVAVITHSILNAARCLGAVELGGRDARNHNVFARAEQQMLRNEGEDDSMGNIPA